MARPCAPSLLACDSMVLSTMVKETLVCLSTRNCHAQEGTRGSPVWLGVVHGESICALKTALIISSLLWAKI